MRLMRNAKLPILRVLPLLGVFASGLVACAHKHPQPQVWREARRRQAEAKRPPRQKINGLEEVSGGSCGSVIYSFGLTAGSSRSLGTRSIAIRDVLGDSLPPGRYLVSALVTGNSGYVGETTAGEVELRQHER